MFLDTILGYPLFKLWLYALGKRWSREAAASLAGYFAFFSGEIVAAVVVGAIFPDFHFFGYITFFICSSELPAPL